MSCWSELRFADSIHGKITLLLPSAWTLVQSSEWSVREIWIGLSLSFENRIYGYMAISQLVMGIEIIWLNFGNKKCMQMDKVHQARQLGMATWYRKVVTCWLVACEPSDTEMVWYWPSIKEPSLKEHGWHQKLVEKLPADKTSNSKDSRTYRRTQLS